MLDLYYMAPPKGANEIKNDEYIICDKDGILYTYYNYKNYHKIDVNKYRKLYMPIDSYNRIKKLIKLDYKITFDRNFAILELIEKIDINSYDDLKRSFDIIKVSKNKPKLLIHSCCGPCSSHILDLLDKYYDITIYYQNSNIDTYSEYKKRLETQTKVAKAINENIEVIDDVYDNSIYTNLTNSYSHLGEKSYRCYLCYYFRLEMCAKYAKEKGFDYFTTTLSISPYKVEKWINEIGTLMMEKYDVKYMYSNFKLENGYIHSIELSKKYDLYRQDYCGCKWSKIEKNKKSEKMS